MCWVEELDKVFKDISIHDIGTALLDLAMPRRCVVCHGQMMLRERFICTGCLADLPLTYFWERTHNPMADRFNERIQASIPEDPVFLEPYAFASALFFYNSESLYKRIPQHLKYHAGVASGRFFSAMLGRALASGIMFGDVDVVVPVPLHWARRWKRGYNQAEVIARELAAALGAECHPDWLRRVRRTATQTRVSVTSKSANVSGAFRAGQAARKAKTAMPCHVLVVDDTFTTGATLNACRMALREVFPPSVRISVATLAFVSA